MAASCSIAAMRFSNRWPVALLIEPEAIAAWMAVNGSLLESALRRPKPSFAAAAEARRAAAIGAALGAGGGSDRHRRAGVDCQSVLQNLLGGQLGRAAAVSHHRAAGVDRGASVVRAGVAGHRADRLIGAGDQQGARAVRDDVCQIGGWIRRVGNAETVPAS